MRHLHNLFLLLLFFSFSSLYSVSVWRQNLEELSAEIELSELKVNILDTLVVTLNLTYPKDYHINSEQLTNQLLRKAPLSSPSFILTSPVSDTFQETSKELVMRKLVFALDPQLPGIHPLTFFNIQFLPNDTTKEVVEIISDIIDVNVYQVAVINVELPKPFPPLPFSPEIPIELHKK